MILCYDVVVAILFSFLQTNEFLYEANKTREDTHSPPPLHVCACFRSPQGSFFTRLSFLHSCLSPSSSFIFIRPFVLCIHSDVVAVFGVIFRLTLNPPNKITSSHHCCLWGPPNSSLFGSASSTSVRPVGW